MISYYTQTSHTLVSKRHARPPLVFLVSYLQFGYHHCIFSENTTPKHLVQWGNIFFLVPDKSKCCKIHCFDSNIETSACINKHKQSKELLVCFCSSTKNRMALCVSILIINCLEYCSKLQYFFFFLYITQNTSEVRDSDYICKSSRPTLAYVVLAQLHNL